MAVMVGFASAASAATLTVFATDLSNVPKDTFAVGETFLLKVTGDAEGGPAYEDSLQGLLVWDAALTTTVATPPGCSGGADNPCTSAAQGNWLAVKGSMILFYGEPLYDGKAFMLNQAGIQTGVVVDTSFITLIADAVGTSQVTWGGYLLDFFGIYSYPFQGGRISVPTGFSFTIVPEPATAALIGLGLLGLAGWRRMRD